VQQAKDLVQEIDTSLLESGVRWHDRRLGCLGQTRDRQLERRRQWLEMQAVDGEVADGVGVGVGALDGLRDVRHDAEPEQQVDVLPGGTQSRGTDGLDGIGEYGVVLGDDDRGQTSDRVQERRLVDRHGVDVAHEELEVAQVQLHELGLLARVGELVGTSMARVLELLGGRALVLELLLGGGDRGRHLLALVLDANQLLVDLVLELAHETLGALGTTSGHLDLLLAELEAMLEVLELL